MANQQMPDHDTLVELATATLGEEVNFAVREVWVAGYEAGFVAASTKAPRQTRRTPQPKAQKDPARLNIYLSEREFYGPEGSLAA